MSLMDDLLQEHHTMKSVHTSLTTELNAIDNLRERFEQQIGEASLLETQKMFQDLTELVAIMNIKVSVLPGPEGIEALVSWPALINALKGLQPDFVASEELESEDLLQYGSDEHHPASDLSVVSLHPTSEELDHIKHLGDLIEKHEILNAKVQTMNDDILTHLQEMIIRIDEELKKRIEELEALSKLSSFLEETKADKDAVMMEIMEKADLVQLETKVDKGFFEGIRHELIELIQDTGERLTTTDESFQVKVEDILNTLETKLNIVDIQPLREYMEKRFKAIGVKLSKLEPQREDTAAGIKKQLLHFHCLSCDRPLEMTPHSPTPSLPVSAPLASTRSLRPYTTYELEQIRQFQKNGIGGVDYSQPRISGGKYTTASPQPPPKNRPDGEAMSVEKPAEKLPNIEPAGSGTFSIGTVGRSIPSVRSDFSLKENSSVKLSVQHLTASEPLSLPGSIDLVESVMEEVPSIVSENTSDRFTE